MKTSTPEPLPAPLPTLADQDREQKALRRLKSPAERVYARKLLEWWAQAPRAERLSDAEAHRVYLRCRRLVRARDARRMTTAPAAAAGVR